MGEALVFSKKRQEIPVVLESDEGNEDYVLREFSGGDRSQFLDFVSSKLTMKDGKVSEMNNAGALQSRLISLCLFDSEDKRVSEKDVLELSSSTINGLFKAAQQLNGLDEGADEEAKND